MPNLPSVSFPFLSPYKNISQQLIINDMYRIRLEQRIESQDWQREEGQIPPAEGHRATVMNVSMTRVKTGMRLELSRTNSNLNKSSVNIWRKSGLIGLEV